MHEYFFSLIACVGIFFSGETLCTNFFFRQIFEKVIERPTQTLQKFSRIMAVFFQNPLKRLRSRLLCAIEITRSQSSCLHVMQSDSGNYTRRKNHSRFCYISRSTQKLYCMDFCRVNQNQHVPIMPRTTEEKRFHSRDQLTYKFLGTKESVYTRKEFNSQGIYLYTNMSSVPLFWNTNMAAVTSCENALYPKHSATALHGLQPE